MDGNENPDDNIQITEPMEVPAPIYQLKKLRDL